MARIFVLVEIGGVLKTTKHFNTSNLSFKSESVHFPYIIGVKSLHNNTFLILL